LSRLNGLLAEGDLTDEQNERVRETIRIVDDLLAKRRQLQGAEQQGAHNEAVAADARLYAEEWKKALDYVNHGLTNFFVDLLEHGGSSFKKLWENFKHFAFQVLAEIASKQIIVSLVGSFGLGGATGAAAAGALGGGSGLGSIGNLLGIANNGSSLLGGGGGLLGSAAAYGAAVPGVGIGSAQAAALAAQTGEFGSAGLAATIGSAGGSTALAGFAAAIPYIGWAVAAGTLLYSLFGNSSHGPKTQGQFSGQFNNGQLTNPVENLTGITGDNQQAGNAQTTATAIAQGISGTLAALGVTGSAANSFRVGFGYSTDPNGSAPSFVHTQVQNAQGQTLFQQNNDHVGRDDASLQAEIALQTKRALLAALQATDLPQYLHDFFASVDAASASADAIDNIIATGEALKKLVDVMPAFSGVLGDLKPENITALVQAFGGLNQFTQSAQFIFENFTTSAQKAGFATQMLGDGFAQLGLQVPKDHQAFLDLLQAQDLSTESGRQMYASISALAPLFVSVEGTADQAAASLKKFHDAMQTMVQTLLPPNIATTLGKQDLAGQFQEHGLSLPQSAGEYWNQWIAAVNNADTKTQQFLQDALPVWDQFFDNATEAAQKVQAGASFFEQNFYTADEQRAHTIASETATLNAAQDALGVAIPRTTTGFRQLIESIDRTTPAGEALYEQLILLAPAAFDVAGGMNKVVQQFRSFDEIILPEITQQTQGFADILNAAGGQLGGSVGDKLAFNLKAMGARLAEAQAGVDDAVKRGFNMDSLNYWLYQQAVTTRDQAATLYHGVADDYARYVTLQAQYGSAIADQLFDLENTFATLRAQAGGIGSDPALLDALNTAFNQKWQDIVTGTKNGVTGTQDALANLMKSITDRFTTDAQKQAAAEITLASGFAKLGVAIPQTYAEFIAFAQSTTATTDVISTLADAFITIHGTAQQAADALNKTAGGLTALQQAQQSLLDYVQKIQTSDASPLSPQDQYAFASQSLHTDFTSAQGGDLQAFGRLTSDADAFLKASKDMFSIGQQYTNDFNEVKGLFQGLGTDNQLQGRADANSAIAAALPTNSKLASASDVQAQTTALGGSVAALTDVVEQLLARIANATEGTETNVANGSRDVVNAIGTVRR
jgi:hypothetical protein